MGCLLWGFGTKLTVLNTVKIALHCIGNFTHHGLMTTTNDTIWWHRYWSSLVQVMAWYHYQNQWYLLPYSTKSLTYCQLDPMEQTKVKFVSKFNPLHSKYCMLKGCLQMVAILFRLKIIDIGMSTMVVICWRTTLTICRYTMLNLSRHWGRDKIAAIFQTTFSNVFF